MDLNDMAVAIIVPIILRLKNLWDQRRDLLSSLASNKMITIAVHIFSDVRIIILLDTTGSPDPQPLNSKLVRNILGNFKEYSLSDNPKLVALD